MCDPFGRPLYMQPEGGMHDHWYTKEWVSPGHDDNYNNGKEGDLCRMAHPNDPLSWISFQKDYLSNDAYDTRCGAWISWKHASKPSSWIAMQ